MTDTPRIEGTPDPRKSSQLTSDDPVDTEKFKRMLKVEESDEAQKQHKRRKPKKTEEEEEIESEEALHNTPKNASFAAIFGAGKGGEGIFAKKAGEKPVTEVSGTDLPLSNVILAKDKKDPKIFPMLNLQESLPKAFVHEMPKMGLQAADSLDTALPVIAPPTPDRELAPTEDEAEANLTITLEETSSSAERRKDEEKKERKEPPVAVPPGIFQPPPSSPPLLTTESPVYAHLPSDVFELYEKMIGLLMIEELKGISITTIKLAMPGSIFNDCEIKLEHFDTAPHSFNIQLLGNPQAIDLFNANFSKLVSSFAQGNYKFQANIRRPILLDSYHKLTKKKPQGQAPTQDETAI